MINQFLYNDEVLETKLNQVPSGFDVTVGENHYLISEIAPGKYHAILNGTRKTICCVIRNKRSYLDIDGLLLELEIPSDDGNNGSFASAHAVAKDKIFAPMPGKIVKLLVNEGEKVEAKQPMVIVEAMKMENQVNSPAAGTVKKINFKDGEQVGTEIPIIELELPV
jgi:acetyl/propionyl-CoA carboxylase alpha subunit